MTVHTRTHRHGRPLELGQSMILFTLLLAGLVGVVGLTIDIGLFMMERQSAQAAADAAALAAVSELPATSEATAKAAEYAELNGYEDGVDGAKVAISTPTFGGVPAVRVEIEQSVSTTFSQVLGLVGFTAKGRATASMGAASSTPYVLITLSESECNAINKSGGGNIVITGGAIISNSSCDTAIDHTGGGSITASAVHYYYEGGYNISGGGTVSPLPAPVTTRLPDPFAAWTPPVPGAPAMGTTGTAQKPDLLHLNGSGNYTLYPGTYYGGIKLNGSGNFTFMPGEYIIAGGGLDISVSGTVTGSDVMFYNTNDPEKPNGAGDYGGVKITSSGELDLAGRTSGQYAGMLFWQDADNEETFHKSGSETLTSGIIYLPNARLDESGSGDMGTTQIVVETYEKTGSGTLSMTGGGWSQQTVLRPRLVE